MGSPVVTACELGHLGQSLELELPPARGIIPVIPPSIFIRFPGEG